jgi:hypothetical protein
VGLVGGKNPILSSPPSLFHSFLRQIPCDWLLCTFHDSKKNCFSWSRALAFAASWWGSKWRKSKKNSVMWVLEWRLEIRRVWFDTMRKDYSF